MRIDLGISVIGDNSKQQKYINITRPDVIKRINSHPAIDPWTKSYLVRRVNDYPDDALLYFVQNINSIVATALNERSKVLRENNEITESEIRKPQEAERSETEKKREDLFSRPAG